MDEYDYEECDPYDDDLFQFERFRNELIDAYKLAEQLNLCKIIKEDYDKIEINMPKYKILSDVTTIISDAKLIIKFMHLLEKMWEKRIIHMDLAFHNIGIDDNGDFQLIDLNEIRPCQNLDTFIKWFSYIKNEFDDANILPVYETLLQNITEFVAN
jgi:hypothetical protein